MAIQLTHFSSLEALTEATVDLLTQHFDLPLNHPYAIMLSGGKTPLEIYRRVAKNHPPLVDSLHLLWSDERMVPSDSIDSNFGNTQELMMGLKIPLERLLVVRTDLSTDGASRDYHSQIQKFIENGGTFPLGLLGLGADGHTASLFGVEDTRQRKGLWAIPVRRSVPPDRVSVTCDLLSRFERLLFLVAGSDKREVLKRFEQHPDSIPAGWAVRNVEQVDVWCWVTGD
jgi:6-phosphogluconolactonase